MAPPKLVFNKEYPSPEWLNNEFVSKVLRYCEKSNEIQVKCLKIISETPKPLPYGSLVLKITVEYQQERVSKTKSMIVKAMPESEEHMKDFMGEAFFFNREFGMYTDVIPKFEEILRETGDNTVFCARCLYYTTSPRKVLVLEDLKFGGYSVPYDRDMTLEEVKTAYLKLAKWHAISHKMSLENPGYFKNYHEDPFSVPGIAEFPHIKDSINLFIELLDYEPSLNEYKAYFEGIRENFVEKYITVAAEYSLNPESDAIYVLCHGDFNANNFMLKTNPETGQLEDVIMFELQASWMGSIANDLIYATYLLLDPKLREEHSDEIFYFYMSSFVETLKKIGFKGCLPKIGQMREQIRKRKHIALFLLVACRPFMKAWFNNSTDKEKLLNSADYRRKFYRSELYIHELRRALPRLLYTGLLED